MAKRKIAFDETEVVMAVVLKQEFGKEKAKIINATYDQFMKISIVPIEERKFIKLVPSEKIVIKLKKYGQDFEFTKLGLPEPDLVLYLELPPSISLSLVKSRSDSTGQKMDIHEKDTAYMDKCYEAALYSCKKLGWKQIKCYEGDKIRTREDIFEEIYARVKEL